MLKAIVKASERALETLPKKKDKGARIKQPMLGGPANYELVSFCYKLFDKYRPGEAKTTGDGDFDNFVSKVYELSAGKEIDLGRQIKLYNKNLKTKPGSQ